MSTWKSTPPWLERPKGVRATRKKSTVAGCMVREYSWNVFSKLVSPDRFDSYGGLDVCSVKVEETRDGEVVRVWARLRGRTWAATSVASWEKYGVVWTEVPDGP